MVERHGSQGTACRRLRLRVAYPVDRTCSRHGRGVPGVARRSCVLRVRETSTWLLGQASINHHVTNYLIRANNYSCYACLLTYNVRSLLSFQLQSRCYIKMFRGSSVPRTTVEVILQGPLCFQPRRNTKDCMYPLFLNKTLRQLSCSGQQTAQDSRPGRGGGGTRAEGLPTAPWRPGESLQPAVQRSRLLRSWRSEAGQRGALGTCRGCPGARGEGREESTKAR